MSTSKKAFIILNLFLLLGYFAWAVSEKENTLKDGQLVLLKLAPVDPRSLMQGDYMRLDYEINDLPDNVMLDKRGYCIVKLNDHHVAHRVRFQTNLQPLKEGEIAIKYFSSGNRYFNSIHIGAESYFFEEGTAEKYQNAKFGALKIDKEGNSVLEGLYNEGYALIK